MRQKTYPVLSTQSHLSSEDYRQQYELSLKDPEAFWAKKAKEFLFWHKEWESVLAGEFSKHNTRWFSGAKLNAAYNCLDRHLEKRKDQPALIWEGDEPEFTRVLSYQQLYEDVCRFANVLKKCGVKRGDRVCIYLPMIPEAAIAMLACTRLGVIHSVVFAGFSAEALKTRIVDADCSLVITANEGIRGNKTVPLKQRVDTALKECPCVRHVIVVKRTEFSPEWHNDRDIWYHDAMQHAGVG